MIKALFLKTINMSITASVVILAVLAIRWLFRKQPKIYSYILWSIVLFRLLCPYSISLNTSLFNALPRANVSDGQIEYTIPEALYPQVESNTIDMQPEDASVNDTVISPQVQENIVSENNAGPENNVIVPAEKQSIDYVRIFSVIWICGGIYLVLNNLLSLYEIKSLLKYSTHLKENIYVNEIIPTAFITGIFRPRIYLPDNLDCEQQKYILLHEQTHIRRKDYIFKLIAFAALCIHWFNPLVWLAYRLGESDMEMSCDEAVIRQLGNSEKRGYSQTLLSISIPKNNQLAMHLAFGEGETKSRIVNVLNFKTPAVKYIICIILVLIFAVIALVSNPDKENIINISGIDKNSLTYSLFRKDNKYSVVDNYSDIIRNLKKISVSSDDNPGITSDIGKSYIVLSESDNNTIINFNEDFTQLWFMNAETQSDCKVFNIKNSEKAEQIFNKYLSYTEAPKEITSIILPSFTNATYNPHLSHSNPVQLYMQLPENWYVSSLKKVIYKGIGYPENSVSIYDHTNSQIGTISYRKLETDDLIEYYISYMIPELPDYSEKMIETHNGNTKILYSSIAEIGRSCIIAVEQELGHAISININRNAISQKQFEDLVSSIELKTPEDVLPSSVDYAYDFQVDTDATKEAVANTAIEHVMSVLNIEYEITDLYIDKPDYPSEYSYTVNYKYKDKNGLESTSWYVIYLKQIDVTTFRIIGFPTFDYYSMYPLYESYTKRVQRVSEIPYETVFKKDSSMTLGDSKIISQGQNGLASQTVDIEYVNGIAIKENVIENNILIETVDNVTAYGSSYGGEEVLTGNGKLVWPVAAGHVARGFTGQYPAHNGIDIAAPTGTAIYAADTGVVTKALYTNVGYGVYCIIEHGGYQTLYAQCSELEVSVGQSVQKGQLIGYVGSTGNSTGPHLHFEVKIGNERYDPYSWF